MTSASKKKMSRKVAVTQATKTVSGVRGTHPVVKSRLGRGLGGIISAAMPKRVPSVSPAEKKSDPAISNFQTPGQIGFQEIAVHLIEPSRYQARKEISAEQLSELAESIRSEGLLQPVVVRKQGSKYELVAGERRWRAFQLLKIKTIPARVVEASNASSATLGLIENLQRADLNPIEEAYGFASLIRDFDLTQEAAAERVGRARASVANILRLLTLDAQLQGFVAKGLLSVGHAKALLSVEDTMQRSLVARRVIEEGLSVRALERLIQNLSKGGAATASNTKRHNISSAAEAAAISSIEKKLISYFGAKVSLVHSARHGKIIINYSGNEDLQRILEKIGLEV